MIAIGCLLLIILPIAGLAIGGALFGPEVGRWGAIIGLIIALSVCGFSAYALIKVSRRR